MKFAFIDGTGQVMAIQQSPKEPAETVWESVHGYTRQSVPDEVLVTRDHRWNGSDFVPNANPVQRTPTYEELRESAYPPLPDQLDMLWHDFEDGTTAWRDTIRAVKQAYPKP